MASFHTVSVFFIVAIITSKLVESSLTSNRDCSTEFKEDGTKSICECPEEEASCDLECTTTTAKCDSKTLRCVPGVPCTVLCDGDEACHSSTILGNGASELNVVCQDGPGGSQPYQACLDTTVICGGNCTVRCYNGCHIGQFVVDISAATSFTAICTQPANTCPDFPVMTTRPTPGKNNPTSGPSGTLAPSHVPLPSTYPTSDPTDYPTFIPTYDPTSFPSNIPSLYPTMSPISGPTTPSPTTHAPTTPEPTDSPTSEPSDAPSTTATPSHFPSKSPTNHPSLIPSANPHAQPSNAPSYTPVSPTTPVPTTHSPTNDPFNAPSMAVEPSDIPSKTPTKYPSLNPSLNPSTGPSDFPSSSPTHDPSHFPSNNPTVAAVPTTKHPTHKPIKRLSCGLSFSTSYVAESSPAWFSIRTRYRSSLQFKASSALVDINKIRQESKYEYNTANNQNVILILQDVDPALYTFSVYYSGSGEITVTIACLTKNPTANPTSYDPTVTPSTEPTGHPTAPTPKPVRIIAGHPASVRESPTFATTYDDENDDSKGDASSNDQSNAESEASSENGGILIPIVVAAPLCIIAIAVLIYCLLRKRAYVKDKASARISDDVQDTTPNGPNVIGIQPVIRPPSNMEGHLLTQEGDAKDIQGYIDDAEEMVSSGHTTMGGDIEERPIDGDVDVDLIAMDAGHVKTGSVMKEGRVSTKRTHVDDDANAIVSSVIQDDFVVMGDDEIATGNTAGGEGIEKDEYDEQILDTMRTLQ
eukprot:325318_1